MLDKILYSIIKDLSWEDLMFFSNLFGYFFKGQAFLWMLSFITPTEKDIDKFSGTKTFP